MDSIFGEVHFSTVTFNRTVTIRNAIRNTLPTQVYKEYEKLVDFNQFSYWEHINHEKLFFQTYLKLNSPQGIKSNYILVGFNENVPIIQIQNENGERYDSSFIFNEQYYDLCAGITLDSEVTRKYSANLIIALILNQIINGE